MICKCGGLTAERHVVRSKQVVGTFERCPSCGRISWTQLPPDKLLSELRATNDSR